MRVGRTSPGGGGRAERRPGKRQRALEAALLGALGLATLGTACFAQEGIPLRLSDWLLQQPPGPQDYPLGLSWRVPGEVPAQLALRDELLEALAARDEGPRPDPAAAERLRRFLLALPPTGRVPVAVADARFLQANPARDPLRRPGEAFVLPRRPRTVTVLTERAERCALAHLPGREAISYLEACSPDRAGLMDVAWIVQPDGKVQRYGVAWWNREKQDEPAPGAWIWGPSRGSGWPQRVSELLAQYLATQGPAADPGAAPAEPAPLGSRRPLPERAGAAAERLDLRRAAGLALPLLDPAKQPELRARSRGLEVSASDWGSAGLLQTPTARMRRTGDFSFTLSHASPYTHGNLFVQPFDWLEAGFRYSNIGNRPYTSEQSYKDKSFDAKVTLWRESAYLPELAVGIRDFSGTGVFGGEFLVGSKRFGDFDLSLGLGWGQLGARGDFRNPLGILGRSFDHRDRNVGQGGDVSFGTFFRGRAALFGGLQYRTPWEALDLKLEYEGNDYQSEALQNNQKQGSPLNVGFTYRYSPEVHFSAALERGNTLMLGLTLRTDLDRLSMPKVSDPPRVLVSPASPGGEPDWRLTARDIAAQTDWRVSALELRGSDLVLEIEDPGATYWAERVDRVAAVLHRDAPAQIDRFIIAYRQRGLPVAQHLVERESWVAERTRPLPPRERYPSLMHRDWRQALARESRDAGVARTRLFTGVQPRFTHGLGVGYQQTLGGPDGFILYQFSAVEQARLRIREDTWLQARVQLGLLNNYDKFKVTGPSDLPRVRTYLREYLTTSRLNLTNLQLTHVGRWSASQYYSLYGGYLEEMFGGVGGEWLYRPFGTRLAFGVDVNVVRQRDFRQHFSFLDYRVTTGHATLYWDTGWNAVQANLSAGRYLAGDKGATLTLSRTFDNGVSAGAFVTRTNVSAERFGEGSFDKGVFLRVPFDAFLTRSSASVANVLWRPLTRDGGAMLARAVSLYGLTGLADERSLRQRPAPRPDEQVIPADRRDAWTPPAREPAAFTQAAPKARAETWSGASEFRRRLEQALYAQSFRDIEIELDASQRLTVRAANERIRPLARAAGRAARTALALAPLDAREIRIVLTEDGAPLAAYDFADLERLARHFEGTLEEEQLAPWVAVETFHPGAREQRPLQGLADLARREEARDIAALVPQARGLRRIAADFAAAGRAAAAVDWLRAGTIGAGLVFGSALLDRRAFRFADEHAGERWLKAGIKLGDALPWLGVAGAGLAALDASDPVRARAGYAALEAGASAVVAATALKYAVGRERPGPGVPRASFSAFSTAKNFDAFPSRHAALAWSLATPFAAEYDAPWLYGVAALTTLARAGSREHWASDTVAGSLLGYALGRLFHESSRTSAKNGPRVVWTGSGVGLAWRLP